MGDVENLGLGLEVIKLEFILRRVPKQPIIALYFESETVLNVLKFYNLGLGLIYLHQ